MNKLVRIFVLALTLDLLSDMWKYNNSWQMVYGNSSYNQLGYFGTKNITSASNFPGARYGSALWIDANKSIWIFGGYGYASSSGKTIQKSNVLDRGNLNDLWKFENSNWTWISGSNITDDLGSYGTQGIGDVSNSPSARVGMSTWTDSNNIFWMYGGSSMADLWSFDGNFWTWVSGSQFANQSSDFGTQGVSSTTNTPGSRDFSTTWNTGTTLYLFGGLNSASGIISYSLSCPQNT